MPEWREKQKKRLQDSAGNGLIGFLYLNLKLLLLFIKPDFTAYRLVSISSGYLKRAIYKSFNIHNLNGFKKLEEIYAK
jgi:hypothetical protein